VYGLDATQSTPGQLDYSFALFRETPSWSIRPLREKKKKHSNHQAPQCFPLPTLAADSAGEVYRKYGQQHVFFTCIIHIQRNF
jgi:hypothetical protein